MNKHRGVKSNDNQIFCIKQENKNNNSDSQIKKERKDCVIYYYCNVSDYLLQYK